MRTILQSFQKSPVVLTVRCKNLRSHQIIKNTISSLVLAVALLSFSLKVEADTLFEGYYKVILSGIHSGYVIQRYDLDPKKKEFTGRYFVYVKTSPDGKQFINESLIAKANDKFQPLSYQYSSLIATADPTTGEIKNNISTIDASFKGQRMTIKGIKDGKNLGQSTTIPNGAFLSNFLIYLMLQKGFKVGRNFEFSAVAEEEAKVHKGFVHIVAEEKVKGQDAYKIKWSYKGIESESYISSAGHPLSTESPAQKAAQELVASREEAVKSFPFPQQSIKKVFGSIPDGKAHPLAKASQQKSSVMPAASHSEPPPAIVVKPTPTDGP